MTEPLSLYDGRCLDSLLWLVEQVQDGSKEELEVQKREVRDVE